MAITLPPRATPRDVHPALPQSLPQQLLSNLRQLMPSTQDRDDGEDEKGGEEGERRETGKGEGKTGQYDV